MGLPFLLPNLRVSLATTQLEMVMRCSTWFCAEAQNWCPPSSFLVSLSSLLLPWQLQSSFYFSSASGERKRRGRSCHGSKLLLSAHPGSTKWVVRGKTEPIPSFPLPSVLFNYQKWGTQPSYSTSLLFPACTASIHLKQKWRSRGRLPAVFLESKGKGVGRWAPNNWRKKRGNKKATHLPFSPSTGEHTQCNILLHCRWHICFSSECRMAATSLQAVMPGS